MRSLDVRDSSQYNDRIKNSERFLGWGANKLMNNAYRKSQMPETVFISMWKIQEIQVLESSRLILPWAAGNNF